MLLMVQKKQLTDAKNSVSRFNSNVKPISDALKKKLNGFMYKSVTLCQNIWNDLGIVSSSGDMHAMFKI